MFYKDYKKKNSLCSKSRVKAISDVLKKHIVGHIVYKYSGPWHP